MKQLLAARASVETEVQSEQTIAGPASIFDRQLRTRAVLKLAGRYMLEDGSEYSCETVEIWAGGLSLKGPKPGPWGSGVLAYIDGLGRLEGVIIARSSEGFSLAIRANPRKEGRLSQRMESLLEGEAPTGTQIRTTHRMRIEHEAIALRIAGQDRRVQLLDVSTDGAALVLDFEVALGEDVRLDGRSGRVVRKFPGGVAVRFL